MWNLVKATAYIATAVALNEVAKKLDEKAKS